MIVINYNEKDFTKEQWEIINNIEDYVDEFNKPEFDFVPLELKDKWIKIKNRETEIKKEMEELHQYYEDVKADKLVPSEGKEKFIKTYESAIKNIEGTRERMAKADEFYKTFDDKYLLPEYKAGGYFTSDEFLTIENKVDKDIKSIILGDPLEEWKVKKIILREYFGIDWLSPIERYDKGGRKYLRYEIDFDKYLKITSKPEVQRDRINFLVKYFKLINEDPFIYFSDKIINEVKRIKSNEL